MQTFLPYPDLRLSCRVLDDRRLGKQRVETFQILRALTWPDYAWKNHPAVRMWRGFVPALVEYGLESCREWTRRGHSDSVAGSLLGWTGGVPVTGAPLPLWFGLADLHRSHRSALLRKDPAWYRPRFAALGDGDDPADLPYVWPPPAFPCWPVRSGPDGVPLVQAARLLGLSAPHSWQADAVAALAGGRDVLLVARPGTGGRTAGLLAGLTLSGRTLWLAPWDGPVAPTAPEPELPPPPAVERYQAPDRPPTLARPPGPAELAAMRCEQAPPEFLFAHPDRLPTVPDDVKLLVVHRAALVPATDLAAVARAGAGRPRLLIVDRADAVERARLCATARLVQPVHAGGGWDPATTRLDVRNAASPVAARRALLELVRQLRPALVVTASRQRAERLVTGLLGDGLRAAVWAPPPMRASRATAALDAWRSRRLDALVVPAGVRPPLGRVCPAVLVGDGTALDGVESWHELVMQTGAARAVLLAGPGSPDGVRDLAAQPGCRRAALLAPFGEPVQVPCGRCDVCAPGG